MKNKYPEEILGLSALMVLMLIYGLVRWLL